HAEALLRLATGDRRGACAALHIGLDVLDRFRAGLGATELRANATGAGVELAGLGMALALESGRGQSVLRWAERWRAGALLLGPVRPPEDEALATSLAELRHVAKQAGDAASAGDSGELPALLARQAALERVVRHQSRHAPGASSPGTSPPSPKELAAALGPAALVEYVVNDGGLWAVVVAGGRTALRDLGALGAVTAEIDALRFALRRLAYGIGAPSSLDAADQMAVSAARRLDELLLGPLGIAGSDGAPLVLVPTGPLHALPWATLPSCRGRPVSLAPSAALWLRATTAPMPAAGGRAVFVAGPGLEHAAAEVAALARRHPDARRFTGRRAGVDAVAVALDGAGLAHVAAHGRFRADNPMFTALDLADGPLTVFDLERLPRPPLHVVLSACDSGLATVHAGDELIGLAAALLAMGTRSLVASVVPVPDDASLALMVGLHRRLRHGDAPAVALAGAQLDVTGPAATRRDRVAAAGFVCLGAG
ncbi:MAG: CHAT domain-containing protein, partial [Acidimicrobiales bacterium]